MKVELKVSMASNVTRMSGCTKGTEAFCGVMYRMG